MCDNVYNLAPFFVQLPDVDIKPKKYKETPQFTRLSDEITTDKDDNTVAGKEYMQLKPITGEDEDMVLDLPDLPDSVALKVCDVIVIDLYKLVKIAVL